MALSQIVNERRPLTISSDGSVEEYELIYIVNLTVLDPVGNVLSPQRPVRLVRTYTFDTTQVLAKEGERRQLILEMRNDAVRAMLLRLQAIKKPAEVEDQQP